MAEQLGLFGATYQAGQLVKLPSGEVGRVYGGGRLRVRVNGEDRPIDGAEVLPSYAAEDVSYTAAVRAHYGTSHVPEHRGYLHFDGYDAVMAEVRERMEKHGPEQWEEDFEEFRRKYKGLYATYLHRLASCLSPMIAGPSKFPTRRAEKANNAERNAWQACEDLRTKTLARYTARAANVIRSDDSDAVTLLRAKLAKLEAKQETYKKLNAAARKYSKAKDEKHLQGLEEWEVKAVKDSEHPPYSWDKWKPAADYLLKNNGAEIRRCRQRVEELEREAAKRAERATAPVESLYDLPEGVTVEEDEDAGRVRIIFPGKPREALRATLKRHGFKWAPSAGAWQRMLNEAGRYNTKVVLQWMKDNPA